MSEEQVLEVSLEQVEDFEFRVRFDGTAIEDLATGEPPPQGHNAGPNPARLLPVAVRAIDGQGAVVHATGDA